MRLPAVLVIILALLVTFGVSINHSLKTSAGDLTMKIEWITDEIKNDRWESADQQARQLEKTWAQHARWWPIFLDHQEIDNIEFSLAKIEEYVSNQDRALSLAQLSELKLMVEHIPRSEAVTIENIL